MNVTCTGCPAKYAVPDEKVRGKKVRITCKHCGTQLVVDGTAMGADQSLLPKPALQPAVNPSTTSVHELTSEAPKANAAPAAELTFIVAFADDRQEPHPLPLIVDMYQSGKIDDETLVWKDGMADWLSPFDVPEIAAALESRGIARRAARSAHAAFSASGDDEPTVVARSPFDDEEARAPVAAPAPAVAPVPAAAPAPALAANPKPFFQAAAAPAASPKPAFQAAPAAARRSDKRSEGLDLFGAVADAGSEHDASLDFGAADEPAHKLTGARNESSVLFSLDALTKPDPKANQKQKARDKEQEQQAEALFGESAPNSLLNIGGGGLAALTAPDFTKPVSAAPLEPALPSSPLEVPTNTPTKSRGGLLLAVTLLGIAAVAGGAFVMMKKEPAAQQVPDVPSAETKTAIPAPPSTSDVPSTTGAAPASAAAEAPSANAQATPAASGAATAKPTPTATPTTLTVNKPAEPAAGAKKADAPPTPAPAAEGAPFDKGAAVTALGAAAASAGSCKKPDGPTGAGKVSVTFAPSGRATMTNVGGAFAGTEVGGCVARLFRAVKVPAFSGDPVTVSKSFSIE